MNKELQPRVAVLKAPGTNCDVETAYGFELAGARPQIILMESLKRGEVDLSEFQIAAFPGGFSYGDDLGSGTVFAAILDSYFGNQIERFREKGLMIGICNGDQILMRSGLLPFGTLGERQMTLDKNDSGKFKSGRVKLSFEPSRCVFLQDMKALGPIELQVAHGEGKHMPLNDDVLRRIEENDQVVFRYLDVQLESTEEYPYNPNGSPNGIAGICDPSGRILGLMPHPERSILREQYPNWRRMPADFEPQGLKIFQRMVEYASQM